MKRKRTIKRLIDRHKISITLIPKIRIKIRFRTDGSWTFDFGYKSYEYLVSIGAYWDENGSCKYKGKRCGMSGQDYVVNQLWRYVQQQAYFDNIHDLDLCPA